MKEFFTLKQDDIDKINKQHFKWQDVKLSDVLEAVKKMSNSKSEDIYGLSNYVIKKIIDVIAHPLMFLINWMFREAIYPSCMKNVITIPIYKSGDKNFPGNYRSISLIPVISKVIESIVFDQLSNYLEKMNCLHHHNLDSEKEYQL